jgi:DNA repair protein RadC
MAVLIAALPPHDRPRERLLTLGARSLSDRELLALLLRNGTVGKSALDVAGELLADYGGLDELALARPEELAKRNGIGPVKAAALVAAFRLADRASSGTPKPPVLRRPEDVAAVARRELAGALRERVIVLICDATNRLRRTEVISDGSIDRSLVPVREILNAALRHDGRSFALSHNHPGGTAEPSEADRRATADVAAAAKVAGLRFLGHVIIAGDDWCSVN